MSPALHIVLLRFVAVSFWVLGVLLLPSAVDAAFDMAASWVLRHGRLAATVIGVYELFAIGAYATIGAVCWCWS